MEIMKILAVAGNGALVKQAKVELRPRIILDAGRACNYSEEPEFDTSFTDTSLYYKEGQHDLKHRYPHLVIEKPPEDDIFSVNSGECVYCGKGFEGRGSTRRYCCPSHRVLMCRKLKKRRTPPSEKKIL